LVEFVATVNSYMRKPVEIGIVETARIVGAARITEGGWALLLDDHTWRRCVGDLPPVIREHLRREGARVS
jgi:hypothetical protein